MADRRIGWERERRRRAADEEDDGGAWDDPIVRGPVPEDPRWIEEQRRFGREWRPSPGPAWGVEDDRFARPRGGMRDDQRGAYTGWGYRGNEDDPRRTYWYGRPPDRDAYPPLVDPDTDTDTDYPLQPVPGGR
jgi:hypothetical protein